MRILVLMPCNKTFAKQCQEIAKEFLDRNPKNVNVFIIPMFMEYLTVTNQASGVVESLFFAIKAAQLAYEADNTIIFGNIPKDYKFDAVFEFNQDYVDYFIDAINEVISGDDEDSKKLKAYTTNLYGREDSRLQLHDVKATVKFLIDYCNSSGEAEIKELEEKYKKKIEKILKTPITYKMEKQVKR